MSLGYSNLVVADARVAGLHGQRILDGYRLRVAIEISPTSGSPEHEGIVLSRFGAEVHCGTAAGTTLYVGRAIPEAPLWLRTQTYQRTILFDLDLSQSQLAALERLRSGGSLEFRVDITAEAWLKGDAVATKESRPYTCHLEEWSRVLDGFGYGELIVLGIPIPAVSASSCYRSAAGTLQRAHEDYVRGRYDDVVARTRNIIEEIWAANDLTAKRAAAAAEKYHSNRRQMTKEERSLFVQEAIRHYAHPPHHAEGPQSQRWYSSSDAALCLGMASALLAEVIAGEGISRSDETDPTT